MKTFLISLSLIFFIFCPQAHAQKTGDYSGVLNVMGRKIPLVFHVHQNSGHYKVTMDSPKQGAFGMPVKVVFMKNDSVHWKIPAGRISYQGKFITADSIAGRFSQNGMKFPLNLIKGKVKKPERPQNPKKPYPYEHREVTFTNKKAGISLTGTLTLPKKGQNLPAVILVSGSGPQDRNESVAGHQPFLVWAHYLTQHGIAVLRYDERGIGESEGQFKGSTTADFARDAAAALNFLAKQNRIDTDRLGIIGHSEGGMVAQIIAAKNEQLDFAVMLAGPAIPGDELLLLQKKIIERKKGGPRKKIQKGVESNRGAFAIMKKTPLPQAKDSLRVYYQQNGIINERRLHTILKKLATPWMKYFLSYRPQDFLKQTDIPMLALFGGKDVQVPAQKNAEALQQYPNIQIKTFPGLNHLFQEAQTGLPREYTQIEETIAPKVLSYVKKWILKE